MRTLETSQEEVERALAIAVPGWFETSLLKDTLAAHELLALVRGLVDRCDGTPYELFKEAEPWLEVENAPRP